MLRARIRVDEHVSTHNHPHVPSMQDHPCTILVPKIGGITNVVKVAVCDYNEPEVSWSASGFIQFIL